LRRWSHSGRGAHNAGSTGRFIRTKRAMPAGRWHLPHVAALGARSGRGADPHIAQSGSEIGVIKTVAEARFDRTAWGAASSNHTISTIQFFRTADFHADSKRAVSVGIFTGIIPRFRVSGDTCGLSGRFWPPVSACKNFVPRGRVSTANTFQQLGILGVLGGQNRCFEPGP